jgi:Rab-GTPase-TBC domain
MHTQLVQLANLLRCLDPELYEYLKERSCTNMFFCFRWVLIQFKREFAFDTVMTLWEVCEGEGVSVVLGVGAEEGVRVSERRGSEWRGRWWERDSFNTYTDFVV